MDLVQQEIEAAANTQFLPISNRQIVFPITLSEKPDDYFDAAMPEDIYDLVCNISRIVHLPDSEHMEPGARCFRDGTFNTVRQPPSLNFYQMRNAFNWTSAVFAHFASENRDMLETPLRWQQSFSAAALLGQVPLDVYGPAAYNELPSDWQLDAALLQAHLQTTDYVGFDKSSNVYAPTRIGFLNWFPDVEGICTATRIIDYDIGVGSARKISPPLPFFNRSFRFNASENEIRRDQEPQIAMIRAFRRLMASVTSAAGMSGDYWTLAHANVIYPREYFDEIQEPVRLLVENSRATGRPLDPAVAVHCAVVNALQAVREQQSRFAALHSQRR